MSELVEMGRVSERGQIAIPIEMRRELGLDQGSKVLFFLQDDTLLLRKVSAQTWAQVTKPLRQLKKRISQSKVNALVHKMR